MSESLFVLVFMSFSLFCRKSVQSWMRRWCAKKCRRDNLRRWWRSVGGSVEKLLKEDGEVWPSVRLRSLWRSVVAMTVRPAGSSWSSEKWSQYPDSKSWSVLKRRPSTDRCAYDGPSYLPLRGMKRAAEEITKYGTTESMTVRRVVRRPSRVLADFQQLESLFN